MDRTAYLSADRVRVLLENLRTFVRQEETRYRTLTTAEKLPEGAIDHFDPAALLVVISMQSLQSLGHYRADWDEEHYDAAYTLVRQFGATNTENSRYFLVEATTFGAKFDPSTVHYEYIRDDIGWRAAEAPLSINNNRRIQLYVLGTQTPEYLASVTPERVITWNTVNRLLSSSWYLSRPLHSYGPPKRWLNPHSGIRLGQLAQLVEADAALPDDFLEVENTYPEERTHIRQHPSNYNPLQQRPADHSPPDLSERVLVLDRSPGYTSVLLAEVYNRMLRGGKGAGAAVPAYPLNAVLVGGGASAYDIVLLDSEFLAMMRALNVSIVLFAEISLPSPRSAESVLSDALRQTSAIQLIFLTQQTMKSAAVVAAEQDAYGEDLMRRAYAPHWEWEAQKEERQRNNDYFNDYDYDDDDDDSAMEIDPEQHAQDPNAPDAPRDTTPTVPPIILLPSPLRVDSDSDSEDTWH